MPWLASKSPIAMGTGLFSYGMVLVDLPVYSKQGAWWGSLVQHELAFCDSHA